MGDRRLRSCALACGALAGVALALSAAVVATGAWYLFRETPQPPEETFPPPTHTRYVALRLRPDDEGMRRLAIALFGRGEEMLFAGPPLPRWLRASREEGWLATLPATIEWGSNPTGEEVVRIRFEGDHETPRALFRVLRWGAGWSEDVPGAPRALDLGEAVPALRLPLAEGGDLFVAFVGNRLLASRASSAIERLLSNPKSETPPVPSAHSPGLPREDGHGWTDVESLGADCRVRFSLRLESDDVVRFRAIPASGCPRGVADGERDAFADRLRDEAERIAAAAGLEPSEVPAVQWSREGDWTVSGRLVGLRERALLAFPSLAALPGQRRSDAGR